LANGEAETVCRKKLLKEWAESAVIMGRRELQGSGSRGSDKDVWLRFMYHGGFSHAYL
jgi:hypothetical protein